MAGPGIRTWEMAQAFQRKGRQTAILARRFEPGLSPGGITFAGKASLANLITWISWSDCVIMPGSPSAFLLSILLRKKIIVDQYDPVVFEFLERTPAVLTKKLEKSVMLFLWRMRQRLSLKFGSTFLVANEKQKDFLVGQLTLLGHTGKLDAVTTLPFGIPQDRPIKKHAVLRGTKIKKTDFLMVWGGGIWDWFDPMSLLQALAKIKAQRQDIKVYFPGLKPPSPDSRKMAVVDAFLKEAENLGLLENTVFANTDWTPYGQRADYLLEADAGISLHKDSMETRFAFRTRMLDYLWAGLPIIASRGDSWADLIEKNRMGLTVPCGNVQSIVQAILRLAEDTALRARCREESTRVAQEYLWDNLIARLALQPEKR